MKLYRREKACHSFKTVDEFVLHYNANKDEYNRVLNDKAFVDTYVAQRSSDGKHPKQIQYTISFDGEDLVNVKDVERDLNVIYAEWKQLKEMEAEDMSLVF
jgi:SOS response regulatory protein OraA/RecX